jgi:hypothetical protein
MRKVIESTLVSIDGVIGDPPAWAGEYFDKEAERAALTTLRLVGTKTLETGVVVLSYQPAAS